MASTSDQVSGKEYFWERYFIVYDTLNLSPLYRRLITRHVDLLQPASGEDILDAGAGTGNVTELLAVPGARVTGIDFCAPALVQCRKKVPSAQFHQADMTQPLPFESASFDKVACSVTLHFLPPERQELALSELLRVLRPGGQVALSVFNEGFNAMRIYTETVRELVQTLGFFRGMWIATRCMVDSALILYYQWRIRRGERAGIHGYFSADKLHRTLEKIGFTDVKVETVYAGQCHIAHAAKSVVPVGTLREAAQSGVSA